MKTIKETVIISLFCLGLSSSFAEIPGYQSTDNTGLNKKERIDAVETYLAKLAESISKLEQKLDENSAQIKNLEKAVKVFREEQAKKVDSKLGEAKVPTPGTPLEKTGPSELQKLKADVMALKNQDIEKLSKSLEELSDTVKAIQATLRK